MPTRLILVGGFLGAGKTTLLNEAAQRLAARGHRVGLITNDQAANLVDTRLLEERGHDVREVAGSCFCCNFPALMDAADSLKTDANADIIVAEPVGSCTDLSATIVQPLKDRYTGAFTVAPLSVLIDPYRVHQLQTGLTGTLHPSAVYIIRKQLEEADWIVVNKIDQLSPAARAKIETWLNDTFPARRVFWLSAQTGEGVDEWLDASLAETDAGAHIPDVDYDTYAEGEAVLGWLNAVATVHGDFDARTVCWRILSYLRNALDLRAAAVGHLKLILTEESKETLANLTIDGEFDIRVGRARSPKAPRPDVRQKPGAPSPTRTAQLTINLRAQLPPEELEAYCRQALRMPDAVITLEKLHCLSPGRPVPTHRYTRVV